jgi:hypothetical protein
VESPDSKIQENDIACQELRPKYGRRRIYSENDRGDHGSPSRMMVDLALTKIKSMGIKDEIGFDLNQYLQSDDGYAKELGIFLGTENSTSPLEDPVHSGKANGNKLFYTISAEDSLGWKDFPKVFFAQKEVISPWDSGVSIENPAPVELALGNSDMKKNDQSDGQCCGLGNFDDSLVKKDVGNCQNSEDTGFD